MTLFLLQNKVYREFKLWFTSSQTSDTCKNQKDFIKTVEEYRNGVVSEKLFMGLVQRQVVAFAVSRVLLSHLL